jgi:hypothetical protein
VELADKADMDGGIADGRPLDIFEGTSVKVRLTLKLVVDKGELVMEAIQDMMEFLGKHLRTGSEPEPLV